MLQKLLKELAEKREKFNAIYAKGDTATAEEVKEAGELVTEIGELQAKAKAQEQMDDFAKTNETALDELKNKPVNPVPLGPNTPKNFNAFGFLEQLAGKTFIENGVVVDSEGWGMDQKTFEGISENAYKTAFRAYLRKGERGLGAGELKDLQVGVDADGGFLVPAQFMNTMIERKPTPTRIAGRVTRYQTSSDKLEIPKNTYSADDLYTTPMRVTWTGENPTSPTQHEAQTPKVGLVTIPIHTAMISAEVTNNMLEDGAFNVMGWLQKGFRETNDLLEDNMILNGSGIGQPMGILLNPGGTAQPAIVPLLDAALVTPDGLIDLAYAVPEQYDSNCAYVFNKTNTGRAIAKLKDLDNRYLFSTGSQDDALASARPKELLGYPFMYSGFMPNIAANAFPVIFGDLLGYYLVNRIGFSIQVLNEIEARNNKKVLLGRLRFGGQVVEDWRIKIGKVSAS